MQRAGFDQAADLLFYRMIAASDGSPANVTQKLFETIIMEVHLSMVYLATKCLNPCWQDDESGSVWGSGVFLYSDTQ